jgi:nucleotide-binding universal stress UspA family protein
MQQTTKSIVVHLADDPQYADRLAIAIDLALRIDAHLDVVYTIPPPHSPAGTVGRAASMEFLAEMAEAARDKAAHVGEEVAARCAPALEAWRWHVAEGDEAESLVGYARLADIVVVRMVSMGLLEDMVTSDLAERVLQAAGCPLLLVPATWGAQPVARRILIGWNKSKEAIAAVRDALSLLAAAESVGILAAGDATTAQLAGAELVAYLAQHGVQATVVGASGKGDETLLETAKERGCDLVVMGAFGHSRLAEFVMGGATQFMLRHTTIPVLMRH